MGDDGVGNNAEDDDSDGMTNGDCGGGAIIVGVLTRDGEDGGTTAAPVLDGEDSGDADDDGSGDGGAGGGGCFCRILRH